MFVYVTDHVGKRYMFIRFFNEFEGDSIFSLEFPIAGWHSLDAVGTSSGGGFEISMKLEKIIHW